MRVALFGGSFDPPHRGHVALAHLARERLALDRVLVAPVATQPLKQQNAPTSFADRFEMTRLAFAGEPGTEISLLDAPRPNGKSNYTIDTLATLRQQLGPDDVLFCILGADSFLTIGHWHRSAELLTACDFIVGARPGVDLANIESALPSEISAKPLASEYPHTLTFELNVNHGTAKARVRGHHATRLYLLTDLAEDVSATQIRSAVHGETAANTVLNPAVAKYIRAHHLYAHL
jgi:nicotinate-nucleotide adenylyltransferase